MFAVSCISAFSFEINSPVVDLNASTEIILAAIKNESLSYEAVLQDGLTFLLKNFSLADLALEAEVLSHTKPVLVLFYKDQSDRKELYELGEKCAARFSDNIVIVAVDAHVLYKLAEKVLIEDFPVAMIIHQREEKGRLEGIVLEVDVYNLIESVLNGNETEFAQEQGFNAQSWNDEAE